MEEEKEVNLKGRNNKTNKVNKKTTLIKRRVRKRTEWRQQPKRDKTRVEGEQRGKEKIRSKSKEKNQVNFLVSSQISMKTNKRWGPKATSMFWGGLEGKKTIRRTERARSWRLILTFVTYFLVTKPIESMAGKGRIRASFAFRSRLAACRLWWDAKLTRQPASQPAAGVLPKEDIQGPWGRVQNIALQSRFRCVQTLRSRTVLLCDRCSAHA